MSGIFRNPEILRNARAQLRPGRMAAIAIVCAVLSLVTGFSMLAGDKTSTAEQEDGLIFLRLVLGAQVAALALGGAVACGQSIQREKQMNTFDFQRVTRLTPLELTLGKFFGAAVIPWFITACLVPAALWGALVANVGPLYLLAAYVVMIVGSFTFQAGALLLSLGEARDAGARVLSVFVLLGVIFAVIGLEASVAYPPVGGRLTPLFALAVVDSRVWDTAQSATCMQTLNNPDECAAPMIDEFFGQPVNHFLIFLVVNLIFAGWFLLGVARNIKRDPSVYEIYTPAQSLGFAMYPNVLLLGFGRWKGMAPLEAQSLASFCEVSLFFVLGLLLLRNRDTVRRRLRQLGARATGWIEASWPAPYILAGMLLTGVAVIATIAMNVEKQSAWYSWGKLAIFRVAFLTVWLVRDILYFQWMGLRRGRRTRGLAFVYWSVYYAALGTLFGSIHVYDAPISYGYVAIFVPWPAFGMDVESLLVGRDAWMVALGMQALVAGLFVALQRRRLLELGAGAAPIAAQVPAGD